MDISLKKLLSPLLFCLAACSGSASEPLNWELVSSLPHDTANFTQGLLIEDNLLYEGTGQYGFSRIIRYRDDRVTPAVVRPLPGRYFGEGIAILDGQLFQATWQNGEILVYDPDSFERLNQFSLEGEGWGLTEDGEQLWLSDGTSQLRRLSAAGELLGKLQVTWEGTPLDRLNELEWIEGMLWANRWYDTKIYRISPETGEVTGVLDLTELASTHLSNVEKVLNGIAWDETDQTLWVTGKYWNRLYQLRLFP